jgi:hypothetical protein
MNKLTAIFLLLVMGSAARAGSIAGSIENSCALKDCSAGDKAVTYATQSEMYWACPTRELAEYTETVIGFVSMVVRMGGKFPNISPVTGEPEFQGETKQTIEAKRHAAHVETFDQATALCRKGRAGIRVTIMNNPGNGAAIWVQNDKTKDTFWISAGMLDKR